MRAGFLNSSEHSKTPRDDEIALILPKHECSLCRSTRRCSAAPDEEVHGACGCRDSVNYAHVSCFVRAATHDENMPWGECAKCGHPGFLGWGADIREGFRLVAAKRGSMGDDPGSLTKALNDVADLLARFGDIGAAVPLYREVLEGTKRQLGLEHPDTLRAMVNLATILGFMGSDSAAEAERLHRKIADVRRRTLGLDHRDTLDSISCLADLLLTKGDVDAAESLYREALEGQRRTLGNTHLATLHSINTIANILHGNDDLTACVVLYEEVLAGRRVAFGTEHKRTKDTAEHLARIRRQIAQTEAPPAPQVVPGPNTRLLWPDYCAPPPTGGAAEGGPASGGPDRPEVLGRGQRKRRKPKK